MTHEEEDEPLVDWLDMMISYFIMYYLIRDSRTKELIEEQTQVFTETIKKALGETTE